MLRWLTFPAAVLVLFTALVGLGISGSSIAIMSDAQPADGLLAGEPRGVRSDEYLLVTPSNISSTLQGFPADPWIGLAPTDLEVAVHSGVSLDWTTLFHPDDWGYLVLGPSMGLAFSWWWSFAISLWGAFALIGLLTRAPVLSAALAVVATLTPYSAWWSAAPPSLLLGYGAAVGACLVAAWQARRAATAVAFAVLAAGFGAALALVLYPPWSVSIALVVAAVTLGHAIDRRFHWRRVAWTIGLMLVAAGGVLLAWYLGNRDAIAALAGTYYPGSRVTRGGDADLFQLLSAPLNFWMVGDAGDTLGTVPGAGQFANLSGLASSWLPVPAILLVMVGTAQMVYARLRARGRGPALEGVPVIRLPLWTLSILSAVFLLLFAWSILPVPDWIGVMTQLNRVQASRTPLALGFAAVLLAAVAYSVREKPTSWTVPWAFAAAALTGALTIWAAFSIPWNADLVPMGLALASGIVLGAVYALIFCWRAGAWAAVVLALYAFVSWAPVNPVQQGIGPLAEDPLVIDLQQVTATTANPRTMVFSDFQVVAKVRAAGLQSVSGQTPIPDADVMDVIAPEDERLWNNYAKYLWLPGEPGSETRLETLVGSTLKITIDPCSPELLQAVDPGWAVANEPLVDAPCLTAVSKVQRADGTSLFVYRVDPVRSD